MSDEPIAIREPDVVCRVSHRPTQLLTLWLVLLVGLRGASEFAMMREHGPDAQMGIWNMLVVVKLATWIVAGVIPVVVMIAMWPRRWVVIASMIVLLAWSVSICKASWDYNSARRALMDAAESVTSPVRLSELVDFDGIQAGYELDNRLASNPNTPPDALRKLSKRDQLGTKMCLARNPNTPLDVLEQIRREQK
jgi:hypothetical protein